MKRALLFLSISLISAQSFSAGDPAGKENTYRFSVDLTQVMGDKLKVELLPPLIGKEEVVYRFPKIVPGTYEIYNFGRFVSEFKAEDKQGKAMEVQKLDDNSWKIKNAKELAKISYWVEDTWDTEIKGSFVFEPAGTNIEDGKNFVINTHAFFGYFDDMKKQPFQVEVIRPEKFYGATGLNEVTTKGNVDTYSIGDYMQLVDAPIMYSLPDTSMLKVGGADILVSVYSPNKTVSSAFISKNIASVLKAQEKYLGGKLPIKKYAFIIYLTDKMSGSGASGALEHSYSSLYFLPELDPESLAQTMKDVAAHEFFHITTPLGIHAEQIGNFDYNDPSMSEHLWLYEGCTEYFAGNVQVKNGLLTKEEYLEVIRSKMMGAEGFNDTLPFTRMSSGCLDRYRSQYGNVYEKGALIGMCLDIKLLDLSGGKYRLQDLLNDLSKIYGKERSFKDEELFDQIVKLSYPEIGKFLNQHVDGSLPLPIKETLALAGITFTPEEKTTQLSLGGIGLGYNQQSGRFVVVDVSERNAFGDKMGYRPGDELLSINKKPLTIEGMQQINIQKGDMLKVVVMRKDDKGREKKVKLKARIFPVEVVSKYILAIDPAPSPKQTLVQKAWLSSD